MSALASPVPVGAITGYVGTQQQTDVIRSPPEIAQTSKPYTPPSADVAAEIYKRHREECSMHVHVLIHIHVIFMCLPCAEVCNEEREVKCDELYVLHMHDSSFGNARVMEAWQHGPLEYRHRVCCTGC